MILKTTSRLPWKGMNICYKLPLLIFLKTVANFHPTKAARFLFLSIHPKVRIQNLPFNTLHSSNLTSRITALVFQRMNCKISLIRFIAATINLSLKEMVSDFLWPKKLLRCTKGASLCSRYRIAELFSRWSCPRAKSKFYRWIVFSKLILEKFLLISTFLMKFWFFAIASLVRVVKRVSDLCNLF